MAKFESTKFKMEGEFYVRKVKDKTKIFIPGWYGKAELTLSAEETEILRQKLNKRENKNDTKK